MSLLRSEFSFRECRECSEMADETGRRIIVNNEGRRVKGAASPFLFL